MTRPGWLPAAMVAAVILGIVLAVVFFGAISGGPGMTAGTGPSEADAAADLRAAAIAWLEALDAERRAEATFPFASDERFVWDYRPGPRRGLAIGAMTAPQRDLAWASSRPR